MPFLSLALLALDAFCIIHAARTGRFWPWAFVVLFMPAIGAVAYLVMEVLPEWRGSRAGRQAIAGVERRLDPERRLRDLRERFEASDTLGNRVDLARECVAAGRFDEAIALWDGVIVHPLGHEAKFHQDRAEALLEAGRAEEALQALDRLRREWPDHQSQEGHLIYARALRAVGRVAEAEAEYRVLTGYYAGPQPGLELARLLADLGRPSEAAATAADYVRRIERAPKFNRRQYREVLGELKGLARGG